MKNENIIEELLKKYPLISPMIGEKGLRNILTNLKKVLDEDIEGDVVELGCNVGTTSLFIRRLLDHCNSDKKFHVYDSFEGLPKKRNEDESIYNKGSYKGNFKANKKKFIVNFKKAKIELPKIHVGWFKDILDEEYPSKIAFAFFDGDFYSSIIDSFNKVYFKLIKGARVVIHDYNFNEFPGVKKACNDFLEDKPENIVCDPCAILVKK